MKLYDFERFMKTFLELSHKDMQLSWSIEISTSRDKKIPRQLNKYTLFIIDTSTKNIFMKSDEFEGSNKNNWSASKYAEFICSFKKV